MKSYNKLIQLLTIALNSIFIGAMALIGLVLVPFWKASEPQVFLEWFTTYSKNIGSFMVPFGPGVLILAVIAFLWNRGNRILWGLTVLLTLANILYFPIYYMPTNSSFAEQAIPLSDVGEELNTWLCYHWQRLFFALGALFTSMLAVGRTMERK